MEIDKLLCNINGTLKDALEVISRGETGTAFVVNDRKELCGVIVDGDIRRLLLNGGSLTDNIKEHLNPQYVYMNQKDDFNSIIGKFNTKIRIIPIVNEQNQIVDYCEYNNKVMIPISKPELKGNELKYLTDAFLSTWISSTGKYIDMFEEKFAQFCGVKYSVAVSNGTAALHLALLALGIGKDDEVIVPDITFAATINAVLYVGATPVIVDIEEDSWCISPIEVEKAITDRTKAIIPVHIYGQPCDMEKVMHIAKSYGLFVVEDCAEAHGAAFNQQAVGSFGDISCFSFFGNKVVTTGEGGMCVTNSKELSDNIRLLKDHGMSRERKYYHEVVGYNYRMTNLQAAIGVAQLEKVDFMLQKRNALEGAYRTILKDIPYLKFQQMLEKRQKISWLVTVLVPENLRDLCMRRLKEAGIDVRPFFIPLSEMELYRKYLFSNEKSVKISKKGFSLPTSLDITERDILRVKEFLSELI